MEPIDAGAGMGRRWAAMPALTCFVSYIAPTG